MTTFELRGLALIARTLLKDMSYPSGKVSGGLVRVKRVGSSRTMTFYIHQISGTDIEIEDQEIKVRLYSQQAKSGTLYTLKSQERTYNEIWIEQMSNPYLKGRDNYGRFEIRVDSYSRVRVKDDSEGTEYEYELS